MLFSFSYTDAKNSFQVHLRGSVCYPCGPLLKVASRMWEMSDHRNETRRVDWKNRECAVCLIPHVCDE